MDEGRIERQKSLGRRKKKRKSCSLFEWSKGEELNLLKKLVEFTANNIAHEEFYPFLRNGSSLAEVSKIQIFDKIQQLKNKYLEKLESTNYEERDRDEGFELSKQLWSETKSGSASTSKLALDEWNMNCFEGLLHTHGLDLDLFTPSFLEATKKEAHELFRLQDHHFLIKSNLKAQLAQLKYHIHSNY